MIKNTFARLVVVLLMLLTTACDRFPSDLLSWGQNNTVDIVIERIAETGQPGQFTLTGTTDLPDQTPLTVSAVRRIGPLPSDEFMAEASQFAILDRKSAVVNDGRWQAQLSLWEVSAEGTYQENWQTVVGSAIDPAAISADVAFLATLEPRDLAQSNLMARTDLLERASSPLLNITPDGEPYLRSSQFRVVPLPGNAMATAGLPQETQGTWEGRSTLRSIDSPEITPIPFLDADNLSLPEQNAMR
ncbi:MAG: hypothetical protein EA368_06730 [Leptolyngbya sp. DLM2.Bin27]|nr:MAG: hypothetical protein EA368_06730 [Leptolyngbya sp. DLM2.Bin27]